MFLCKLCEQEYVFTTYICEDCRGIRHLMNIYNKEVVLEVLDKCLVIDKFKKKENLGDAPTKGEKEDEAYHIKLRDRKK